MRRLISFLGLVILLCSVWACVADVQQPIVIESDAEYLEITNPGDEIRFEYAREGHLVVVHYEPHEGIFDSSENLISVMSKEFAQLVHSRLQQQPESWAHYALHAIDDMRPSSTWTEYVCKYCGRRQAATDAGSVPK